MMYCSCGFDKECVVWCGEGHVTGQCPPLLKTKPKLRKPTCKHCGNHKPPFGDARNLWISYHESWSHRVWWTLKKKLTPEHIER